MNLQILEMSGDYIFWTLDGQDGKCELSSDHTAIVSPELDGGPFDLRPDTLKLVRDEVQRWLDDKPSRDEDYDAWNQRYEYYRDVWSAWGTTAAGHGIDHAFPAVYHRPDEVAIVGTVEFIYHGWKDGKYRSQPVTNPTWGDVLRLFEKAIRATRDYRHVYLEGIAETSKRGVWTFCSGS